VNVTLIAIFTLELTLKIYAYRWRYFQEACNLVDFVVVIVDIMLLMINVFLQSMPKVTVLRIFRLARLSRSVKAVKMFPELNMLLRGFINASKDFLGSHDDVDGTFALVNPCCASHPSTQS